MISKIGLLLLFGTSIVVIIAILIVDISNEPAPKLYDQLGIVPIYFEPAPMDVTCDELYTAYLNNNNTADIEYKGKRLLFLNVEVTDVSVYYTLSGGELVPFISCFTSGNIKFQMSDPYIMQSVEVGYILNIVGQCRGLSQDYVFIWDCWAESVLGDLGPVKEYTYGY